jgi:curved DNA-binding protein CbpA
MPGERSYYEVLGLPKTAALADIKKRYRELARQHHPDVNRDRPDAEMRFSEITRAYKTLSNPDERATYDADLALRERRAAAGAARARATTFPGASTSGSSAGGAATRTTSPPPRPGSGNGATRPNAAAFQADTARLLAQAQAAFVRGKFVEARALCEQVLRRDRRSATAYEILGDVYRLQGKTEEAIQMYTMALQINPRNNTIMERIERLARSSGPSAQRVFFDNRSGAATGRGGSAMVSGAGSLPGDKRPLKTLILGVLGYSLAMF